MFEHPLPLFAPNNPSMGFDPGPSFPELMQRIHPEGSPNPPGGGEPQASGGGVDVVHGTTVVAIRYASGVVMAGDRRATSGNFIAGRRMEKVAPADETSGVPIARAAGMAVGMGPLFQTPLQHQEQLEDDWLSLVPQANPHAQLERATL